MEFKFAIGEKVRLCLDPNTTAMIIERLTQECPGGVQRHYVVRTCAKNRIAWGATGGTVQDKYQQFHEIELEAIPEPEPAKEKTVRDALGEARELAVAGQDFQLAAAIRDLRDKHKQSPPAAS